MGKLGRAAAGMGVDEAGIKRSHACLGFSAYIAGGGFLGIVSLGISHAASGSLGGALAAIEMAALTGVVAATHSFRCWKLRKREINSGFGEFASSPSSWLPPFPTKGRAECACSYRPR